MTVPTTGVTFSSIQTEFGGANPISLSEYYRGAGGGYVPTGTTTSATDGTAIAASGAIRVGMFRAVSKVTTGLQSGNHAFPAVYVDNTSGTRGGSAQAHAYLFADGTTNAGTGAPSWYTPTTTGVVANYWFRLNVSTGAPTQTTLTSGSWVKLTSTQNAYVGVISTTAGIAGNSNHACTGSIDIAATSGGPVLASWSFDLTAIVESGA